jgi:kynurenine formamidase
VASFVDLSHTIVDGMITYPGLPGPVVSEHITREASRERYAPGTEFSIGHVSMVANTGTYLDTPFHRYPDGFDLAALPLGSVCDLPAVVVASEDGGAIDVDAFEGLDVGGAAVLVRTGWDRHWGADEYGAGGHPFVTGAAAEALVERRAALVGIDSVNIDATATGERPAHTILLAAGIPIVEHLTNLGALPATGARFFAVPPKIVDVGTFTVRAFAMLQ